MSPVASFVAFPLSLVASPPRPAAISLHHLLLPPPPSSQRLLLPLPPRRRCARQPLRGARLAAAGGLAAASSAVLSRSSAAQRVHRRLKEEDGGAAVTTWEAALLHACDAERPIFAMICGLKAQLAKAAQTRPAPGGVGGDWIAVWATREDAVVDALCSGETAQWNLYFDELLIRFGCGEVAGQQDGSVEVFEVIRPLGPFPNRLYKLSGSYALLGDASLNVNLDRFWASEAGPLAALQGGATLKAASFEVVYVSKSILVLEWPAADGKADVMVLKPIQDFEAALDKHMGGNRRAFFDVPVINW